MAACASKPPRCLRLITVLALLATLAFLLRLIDNNSIVADGIQNLSIAKNILQNFTFSAQDSAVSDMSREPAWPVLTALVLYLTSLTEPSIDVLATKYAVVFKYTNALIYASAITVAASYVAHRTRSLVSLTVFLFMAFALYGTVPRLINNYNNEALATLLVVISSVLICETIRKGARASKLLKSVWLGASLGLLALTKAQFIYICIPVLGVLFYYDKKAGLVTLTVLSIMVAPWIYRNYALFGEPAISKRGKTVAAVRVILTSEPTAQERKCMTYAFTHPAWQPFVGPLLSIERSYFDEGGQCQRLNREICFDMGSVKVKCAPFAGDISASHYGGKVQYFFKGYSAGKSIEEGKLVLKDLAVFDMKFLRGYLETLPLFVWRGLAFSDFPLLALVASGSLLGLMFTQFWPLALLCICSQAFHIFFTHNIPRYHAVEFPVLIAALVFLLSLLPGRISSRFHQCVNRRIL